MEARSISAIRAYLLQLQEAICQKIASEETKGSFGREEWTRAEGGGGITRVLSEGDVIEKGGVNFSHVSGLTLPPSATLHRPDLAGAQFEALGVSVVIHPLNPYVPTTHANVRFLRAEREEKAVWWFGGGFDLTPFYPFEEDCVNWHREAARACAPFGDLVYPEFKKKCDDYFYLKHRSEARGIGGLFFDDLNQWSFETCFSFIQAVGEHFMRAYGPILQKRKGLPYGEAERHFQAYRRGRYVEFNLLQDRGTLFGLQSNGRTESILMSLPPRVEWPYQLNAASLKAEAQLLTFLKPQDWLLA